MPDRVVCWGMWLPAWNIHKQNEGTSVNNNRKSERILMRIKNNLNYGKFEDIINSEKPVLVDFFATWCGPCKMMHPILEELHDRIGDKARIIKVDIDQNQNLASFYNVRSVPTLMVFKNGNIEWRESGVQQAAKLEQILSLYY